MNPRIFISIVIFFGFAFAAANAEACGRCGLFGNKCRFSHHVPHVPHVAPVVAKAADFNQNIIFNNIAPPFDLAPRGETVYGVSRALQYNAPNSALYLDNVRRSIEFGGEATAAARSLDSEFYALASTIEEGETALARSRGFAEAFRAFQGEPRARGVGFEQVTISLKNGKVESINRVNPLDPNQPPAGDPAPVARDFGGLTCLKCHAAGGTGAKKFVIDDTFDEIKFGKAKQAIDDGSMPPAGTTGVLSEAEKARELLKLARLVPVQ